MIYLIAFTHTGAALCRTLTKNLNSSGLEAIGFSKYEIEGLTLFRGGLKEFCEKAFIKTNAIIFIGAVGIAVRGIAPFIKTKDKDPGVIVIDEFGKYVIPILSGHIGKANELSVKVAEILKAKPVITTSTDLNGKFSVDVWAVKNHLYIENVENIKYVSAAILKDEQVSFKCDYELIGLLPEFLTLKDREVGIHILKGETRHLFSKTLILRPKEYFIGIGCRKDTRKKALEEFVLDTLNQHKISRNLVNAVATINIKEKEEAIKAFCKKYSYDLKTFTSEQLLQAEGDFSSSLFVKSIVGVDNVCERAAVLASGKSNLIIQKKVKDGMTVAVAMGDWRCRFEHNNGRD
ncbi:UNVERIFIED_CONTAM: cobalt-precorrin 5A acetaldehyde-lyase [Acetivibrio alkalicellulosi]